MFFPCLIYLGLSTSAAGGFLFGKYLNQNFKCKVIDILYYFN
ncbi:hypothetical protein B4091_0979 [Bacillus licheniformis]|nr:hypothetical protein B4091_0979 [Bacillus licheniformis]